MISCSHCGHVPTVDERERAKSEWVPCPDCGVSGMGPTRKWEEMKDRERKQIAELNKLWRLSA